MKLFTKSRLGTAFAYLLLYSGTIAMLLAIMQYSGFDRHVGFLRFKQDYIADPVWRNAFYIHVFSCFVCLFAGFTQFSTAILNTRPHLHRFMGRVYVYNIVLINFPMGLILAWNANGLLPSKLAFFILDILWCWFTINAVRLIRQGNIKRHRQFMIRSYALTLSALTLRTWKQVFVNFTDLDYNTIYMLDAWLGFVPNLLIAEWIIRSKRKNHLWKGTV